MTDFKFGDIVLVPFPFSDQTRAKKTPCSRCIELRLPSIPPGFDLDGDYQSGEFVTKIRRGRHSRLASRRLAQSIAHQASYDDDRTIAGHQKLGAT